METHVHFSPLALELHLACAGQALCLLPQLLCGEMYSCPVVFKDTASLESSVTSGSCNLSTSYYMYIPDPQEKEFDENITFRTECSEAAHSLHIVQL